MVYRSKVIIGIKNGKLSNGFDEILKKHDFTPNKSTDYLKICKQEGMKTYVFDYAKWYRSDDWCKDIMGYLESIGDYDNDEECLVYCVGIGEEGELHSEIGDYWDYVDVIRDIQLAY